MTRRRWMADEVSGNRAALTGEHARHLSQVLRARVGQEFDISTGTEVRGARVSSILPDRVEFELGEIITPASDLRITVAISIFKFDRMEWAIEKSTELGVSRIIPTIAARTESHLARAAAKRVDRWQRIAQQASEQSRRVSPPEIADPIKFKELLGMTSDPRIVLSEMEDRVMLKDAIPQGASSLVLAFGPEGGWRTDELTAFGQNGWTLASLGGTILRAETAVIAAISVVSAVL
jgi:16S rRNA (uracil1498-N3)-methyltransferase